MPDRKITPSLLSRRTALAAMGLFAVAGCNLLRQSAQPSYSPPTQAPLRPSPLPSATLSPSPVPTPTGIAPQWMDTIATLRMVQPLRLQHVTETSARLLVELDQPASLELLLWPEAAPDRPLSFPLSADQGASLIVDLPGLQPATAYQVDLGLRVEQGVYQQIGYADQPWGPLRFTTQGGPGPLRFAVLGDSGFGDDSTYRLAQLIASHAPHFVVHTGDVVYNMWEDASAPLSYQRKYYLPFKPLLNLGPLYPVLGNHDIEAATIWQGSPYYHRAFPDFDADPAFPMQGDPNAWYAFSYGQMQFIALNSQAVFGDAGYEEQNAWFDAMLADERFPYRIIVSHVPPYSSGTHAEDSLILASRWGERLRSAPGLVLYLSGHQHNYERLLIDGRTHLISGGGSATVYAQETLLPESQVWKSLTHFVLIEIEGGRLRLRAIDLENQVFDESEISL